MRLLPGKGRAGLQLDSPRELAISYGVAIGTSLIALAIWQLILKQVEPNPFPLLLMAVVISSLVGGLLPGLLATVLTALMGLLFYVDTKHQLHLPGLKQGLELNLYVLIGLSLNFIIAVRRRAQEDMRRQLKVSANITRNLGEGVYAVDQKGKIFYMNLSAERMLGWSERELHGKNLHHLIHTCDDGVLPSGEPCQLPDILRSTGTVRNEDDEFMRKDGTNLPVSYTSSPVLTNGQMTGAVITFRDITDRKRAVQAMRQSEERYRILVETSHDSIWLTDLYGYIIMANERAARLYGYHAASEMLGLNSVELFAPDDRIRSVQDRRKAAESRNIVTGEYSSLRQDGNTFASEVSASTIMDDDDDPRAILHVVRDITDRREADEALRASEARLSMQYAATSVLAQSETLSEAIPKLLATIAGIAGWDVAAFWTVDAHDSVLRCRNISHLPSVRVPDFRKLSQQLTFASGVDLPGRVWAHGEPVWVTDVTSDDNFPRALMAAKEGLRGAFAFPVMLGGSVHSVMEFFSFEPAMPSADLEQSAATIATQLASYIERKQAEELLEYQALHDALTDLPNRILIQDRLQLAVSGAQRNNKPLALMLMDLDRFKEINDSFGHRAGDHILKQVGTRLKAVLRESDSVGRLGGDEFAILLPASDVAGATASAPKILGALTQPFVVDGQTFDVGASIGIAVYPNHGDDASTLLRHADVAMYAAKRANSNYALYDTEQDLYSPSKIALKAELRQAIENDEFLLYYHPKVDLNSGKIDSLEALVRWQHPEHGLLPPDQFIKLAEQNGLIQVLSLQILSAALQQCHSWHELGLDMRVAVNFATSSLQDQQLVGMITSMLKACDVSPDHLEVEITESAIMDDPDRAIDVLQRLHALGIRIVIDDFGTGHSSLAQLKRLPADQIKIDRSIVSDMATNDEDSFITRSIIDLGHKLGLRVVAEGVENQETADILATLGCDLAQGDFLSLPMPADDVAAKFTGSEPRLSSAV